MADINKTLNEMIIDPKNFLTPDMGDYLDNNMIVEAANKMLGDNTTGGEFFIEKPPHTTPGYYEEDNVIVFSGKPTFQSNSEEIGQNGVNITDGDTVYIAFNEIQDGNAKIKEGDSGKLVTIKEYLKWATLKYDDRYEYMSDKDTSISDKDKLGLRIIGLNAPELPHFRMITSKIKEKVYFCRYGQLTASDDPNDVIQFISDYSTAAIKDWINSYPCDATGLKRNVSYMKYDPMQKTPTKRNSNDICVFIKQQAENVYTGKMEDCFFEIVGAPINNNADYDKNGEGTFLNKDVKLKMVLSHNCDDDTPADYFKQALQAQADVINLINGADDIVYMIDQTYIANKVKGVIPWEYKKEYEKISQNPWYAFKSLYLSITQEGKTVFQQMGKRYFGQELNGRYLGAIYIKTSVAGLGVQWINLGKYLIKKYNQFEVLPSYGSSGDSTDNYGYTSDAFKLWTYDKSKNVYVDILNGQNVDDRDKVQQEICHVDLSQLKTHTVMIGDCLFMVPPTSIRVVSQTRSQRISMLRSKGGLTKTYPKAERILEIPLYFNGDEGINGIPYEQKTPSGTKFTYYMNGLRSLVAEFKFTPFLPIENDYLNYILNIEAVTLDSIQINTVPNFPRTIEAVIKLKEFDYREYMPEILPPDIDNHDDVFTNMFSKTINWPLMRYYYQRCIQKGEELSDMDFNSEDYYFSTVGQKTALQRCKFQSPLMELYIANEEFLKKRKILKQSLEKNPIESVIKFTDKEEKFLKEIFGIYSLIRQKLAVITKDLEAMCKPPKNQTCCFSGQVELFGKDDRTITYDEYAKDPELSMGIFWGVKNNNTILHGKNTVYDVTKSKTGIFNQYIKHINQVISEITSDSNKDYDKSILKSLKVVFREKHHDNYQVNYTTDYSIGVQVQFDWNHISTINTLDKLKRYAAKALNTTADKILANDSMMICYTSVFALNDGLSEREHKSLTNQHMYLSLNTPFTLTQDEDYKTMNCLAAAFGVALGDIPKDENNMWTTSQDLGLKKDNIDLETAASMKFDYYDIGFPIIQNVSMSYNNIFTKMSLKSYDGYASQFTGGTDTAIEINMIANDEYTVNQLSTLSRLCVQRMIDFRKIIASSPLRINSELTRMMGVNEVIIESLDISTVPNYPNKWTIDLRLTSVDRTLRNREAMKKLDGIKNTTTNRDEQVKTKNYFEIKNVLSKVELYPDLELPTIKELEKIGYSFIRYKNESERTFPDADFYFSYLHVMSSAMIRESIVNFFKEDATKSFIREYSGDLFDNDLGILKYDLNKMQKDGKNDDSDIKNAIPNSSQTASGYAVGYVTNDSKETYKKLEGAINADNSTEVKKALESTNEYVSKEKQIEDAYKSLYECIGCSNYNTTDVNAFYRISLSTDVPFSTTSEKMLNESKKVQVYDKNGKFKSKNGVEKKLYFESLTNCIKDILSKPISYDFKVSENPDYADFFNIFTQQIYRDSSYREFFAAKKVKNSWFKNDVIQFTKGIDNVIEACACGASAELGIQDGGKDKSASLPRAKVNNTNGKAIPYIVTAASGQGISDFTLASNCKEAREGYSYGRFQIKKYNTSLLSDIFGVNLITGSVGFIDPYYNKALSKVFLGKELTDEEYYNRIDDYIQGICTEGKKELIDFSGKYEGKYWYGGREIKFNNTYYAENAFFRTMLCWLYSILISDKKSLPSNSIFLMGHIKKIIENAKDKKNGIWTNTMNYFEKKGLFGLVGGLENKIKDKEKKKQDVTAFSKEDEEILENEKKELEAIDKSDNYSKKLDQMLDDVQKSVMIEKVILLNGMMLLLGMIAVTDNETSLYSDTLNGNISDISNLIANVKATKSDDEELTASDASLRKILQYIDKDFDTRTNYDMINSHIDTDKYGMANKTNRVYLECADIPAIYLMHSFYDMVMTDMRGRMARAFPTYYMLLIDEGRDMGVWKLQDYFYDVSSITEFEVVKSRKIAADTAKICMTNLFGTFTTEDEDIKDEYQYTFKDMWNSIFSPRTLFDKEYERYSEARDINRAKLRTGARVSLRLGYSSDAAKLPIMFNGIVTEVETGDIMTLICQGDGIELSNPAMFNPADSKSKDAADLEYTQDLISNLLGTFKDKTTPREILLNPLICQGTWIQSKVKDWSKGRFFNSNPFGIVHFGDREYTQIFNVNGEVEQNIYEALNKPAWVDDDIDSTSTSSLYSMPSAPKIKVGIEGRSYWDLMNTAASVSPDFIAAIAPFQMRSTIFFGAPRYYYAYDYDKLPDGKVVEKRKPFQQYHVYTSYTDIISNGITTSTKDLRTVAVGVYQAPGWTSGTTSVSVGPLYLDIDIYPENQKATTINCNFEYKATDLIPFTIPVVSRTMNELSSDGGYQIAWRATANGLRNIVKDMYTGELIVMGDPSVKPYDKVYIYDTYEDIQGMCEVQTVVHSFSVENGFTTSITPDCISAIDSQYEQVAQSTVKQFMGPALSAIATTCVASKLYDKQLRSMFFAAKGLVDKATKFSAKGLNSIKEVIGEDNLNQFSSYLSKADAKLGEAFGVTKADLKIFKSINKIDDAYKALTISKDFTSAADVSKYMDSLMNLEKNLDKINPKELQNALGEATVKGKKSQATLDAANKNLSELAAAYNRSKSEILSSVEFSSDDIGTVIKAVKDKYKGEAPEEITKAIENLSKIKKANKTITLEKDSIEGLKDLKTAVSSIDDLSEDSKILKIMKNSSNALTDSMKAINGFGDLKDEMKAVNTISKGAKDAKMLLSKDIIWTIGEFIISKSVQEFIERKLKNLQVLTIFPLIKEGKVMTAGLDGNKGSVFGSPSYSEIGWMQQQCINFFQHKSTTIVGDALGLLRDMFITTDEMIETINSYKRNNNFAEASGTDATSQYNINTLLSQVAKNSVSGFSAYKKLYFDARINDSNTPEGYNAYNKYSLKNLTEEQVTTGKTVSDQLQYIITPNGLLDKLSKKGVLKFAGEQSLEKETNASKFDTKNCLIMKATEGSDKYSVPCKRIQTTTKDGTNKKITIFSLPFLRPDALIVLNYIVEEICKAVQPDYLSTHCEFEYLHKHNIVIHNGVMVNSNSWFSTGFAFSIEVVDFPDLSKIMDSINKNDDKISQKNINNFKLLKIAKDKKLGGNVYDVFVSPTTV